MIDRRQFLTAIGAVGAASAWPGLGIRNAFADTKPGEAPKRLIIVSHCHGWPYQNWVIRPGEKDLSVPWELSLGAMALEEFSEALAPLYPHRNRMLALDGLSLATAELDMDGNRHDTGWVQAWTGNWADFSHSDTRSQSMSLDQLVAQHVSRADRLPSLEISVDDKLEGGRPIAYGPNGSRLPVLNETGLVWQRLFGPSQAPHPLDTRQQAVLDFAHNEYKSLAPKLGQQQRTKLKAHFDLLYSLQSRLAGMGALTCSSVPKAQEGIAQYDQRFDAFAELVGSALSCDITRVVSMTLGEMPTAAFGADHITDNVHKGLAHGIYDSVTKHNAMTEYLKLHASQVSRLVSVLESLPDVDGNSVMDNTLIVWGSELADGWHGYQHYCPVIIGGSWHFKTGRYMYWPHDVPIRMLVPAGLSDDGYSQFSGKPHQQLLVSIAQAMGVGIDHVGIRHVQGQTGDWVDCSGPLPNLT